MRIHNKLIKILMEGKDDFTHVLYQVKLHDFSQASIFFAHITLRCALRLFIFRQCDVFYFLIVAFSTPRTRKKTLKVSLEERSKVSSTQSHHYCW